MQFMRDTNLWFITGKIANKNNSMTTEDKIMIMLSI